MSDRGDDPSATNMVFGDTGATDKFATSDGLRINVTQAPEEDEHGRSKVQYYRLRPCEAKLKQVTEPQARLSYAYV